MQLIQFLFVCIGLSMTSRQMPVTALNCSELKTFSENFPLISLHSSNPTDEVLLSTEFKIRKKFPMTRVFILRCKAPYPIILASSLGSKDEENTNTVHVNNATEYHPETELFISSEVIVIGPQEEFHLEAKCTPNCEQSWFPPGAEILTEDDDLNYLIKLRIQNVSLEKTRDNSNSQGHQKRIRRFILHAVFTRILAILLIVFLVHWFFFKKRSIQEEEFQMVEIRE